MGCCAPGMKRSMVMTFLDTILPPVWITSADKAATSITGCWGSAGGFSGWGTYISERRMKFKSLAWTVLMSETNTLPSTKEQVSYQFLIKKIYFNKKKRKSGGKQLDQGIGTNPLHAVKGGKGRPRQTNFRAPKRTPRRSSCSNQVGTISAIPDYLLSLGNSW